MTELFQPELPSTFPLQRSVSVEARLATATRLGLSKQQAEQLSLLDGPAAIQDFIDAIPTNYEDAGGLLSVRRVLENNRAHCLEAAFVAALALWLGGDPPFIVILKAEDGEDHAIVPFLREGHWGALSKSNHVWLRYRDPVYQSMRELVMSYFHEYITDMPANEIGDVKTHARKTLRAYTPTFDLSTINPVRWISAETDCVEVDHMLHDIGHFPLLSEAQVNTLRPRDALELMAGQIRQYT